MDGSVMLKRTALELGFRAGLFRLAQLALGRHQAVILTFHRFAGKGQGHPRGLPIQRFEQYVRYLTRRYRVVSLAELSRDLRRGVVKPYRAAITVDDGYHEVSSLVAPLLRRLGVPATFFVVSGLVDRRLWLWTDKFRFAFDSAPPGVIEVASGGSRHRIEIRGASDRLTHSERWREYAKRLPIAERDQLLEALAQAWGVVIPSDPPDEYRALTWSELGALAAQGFDVGAHTRTHPILSRIPPEELEVEIGECKRELEARLGAPVRHFAYPNGKREDYTPEAVEAVARAGYDAAVTAIAGPNAPLAPPYELRRIDAGVEDLAHFAQAASGFEHMKVAKRAGFRIDPVTAGATMVPGGGRGGR
jgi:peptidoglycan/xylan/chitin deacetylase (PgdA/CDA1 family)